MPFGLRVACHPKPDGRRVAERVSAELVFWRGYR
jgi:hypothetical protein